MKRERETDEKGTPYLIAFFASGLRPAQRECYVGGKDQ